MSTIYHLSSAEEINIDFLEAIKTTFKAKPITIVVEEDEHPILSVSQKQVLDERLIENRKDYISAEESISSLRKKYEL
jgi:hypothetical protein